MIKHLHFIWGGSPLPDRFAENIDLWRGWHPDWELTIWGDDDLRWLANRDLFDAAAKHVPTDAIWQFRADIARYEILERHGGFYADVDTFPMRNIEPALEGLDAFAAQEMPKWVGNTYLYTEPEHPVMVELVKNLRSNVHSLRYGRANRLSGPKYLTPIWRRHGAYEAPTRLWFPQSHHEALIGDPFDVPRGTFAVHEWNHGREAVRRRHSRIRA